MISPWFHDDFPHGDNLGSPMVTRRPGYPSSPQRITATERPSSSPRKVRIHSGPQTWWYAWRTKDWWRFFVGKVQKIKRKLRTLSFVIFSCFLKKPFAVKGDSCATGSLNHGKWRGSQPNIVISWNVSSLRPKTSPIGCLEYLILTRTHFLEENGLLYYPQNWLLYTVKQTSLDGEYSQAIPLLHLVTTTIVGHHILQKLLGWFWFVRLLSKTVGLWCSPPWECSFSTIYNYILKHNWKLPSITRGLTNIVKRVCKNDGTCRITR